MTTASKVRSRAAARRWRASFDGTVVFTNGVFDLLHPGHVSLLEGARALGDALVVGVNDDASARRLAKGHGRPVVDAADRARVVAALAAVDLVVLFGDPTPESLVQALAPNILVKGADYDPLTIPGRVTVVASGGSVAVMPLVTGYSSTAIVDRIHASA